MQSQYPWDLICPGFEASLQMLLRRVPPPLTIVRWSCRLRSQRQPRGSLGTTSFRSSSCFPLSSGAKLDSPGAGFRPGSGQTATNPSATGWLSCVMAIGIVLVFFFDSTGVSTPHPVTITSTFKRFSYGRVHREEAIGFDACIARSTMTCFSLPHTPTRADPAGSRLDAGRLTGRRGTS